MSKVIICHKCGGVGHICPHYPTLDSDAQAANVVIDEEDEQTVTFTAVADDSEEVW